MWLIIVQCAKLCCDMVGCIGCRHCNGLCHIVGYRYYEKIRDHRFSAVEGQLYNSGIIDKNTFVLYRTFVLCCRPTRIQVVVCGNHRFTPLHCVVINLCVVSCLKRMHTARCIVSFTASCVFLNCPVFENTTLCALNFTISQHLFLLLEFLCYIVFKCCVVLSSVVF